MTFLEFQWGPSQDLQQVYQQKRQALLQRSSHRVEEIKSRRDGPKVQPEVQAPPREQSKAKDSQPVSCKSKTKTEPQPKTNTKSEGGRAEQQTSDKSGFKQKKVQCRPSGKIYNLKEEVYTGLCFYFGGCDKSTQYHHLNIFILNATYVIQKPGFRMSNCFMCKSGLCLFLFPQ